MSIKIAFPSDELLNSNAPVTKSLFLKFCCREWKNFALPGSGNAPDAIAENPTDLYAGMDTRLATIFVPAPKSMISNVNINYTDDTNIAVAGQNLAKTVSEVALPLLLTLLGPVGAIFGAGAAVAEIGANVNTGRRNLDSADTLFETAQKRAYTIPFTLTATNSSQAKEIEAIAKTFRALALPSKQDSVNLSASEKAYPPPLWKFGVGTGLSGKIDPVWFGQTTLMVLKSVIINTAAGGSPYMVATPTEPKPLITSFSLTFVDYEPVYRSGSSLNVIMRSANTNEGGYGAIADSINPF